MEKRVNKFLGFLKLIRYPNLIFVALTQYLTWFCVILPVFNIYEVTPVLNNLNFYLLMCSTVLITAAGYIINDYFDIGMDIINKPEKIYIDKIIHRHLAMALHIAFNIIAIAIGFYIAWNIGNYKLGFIQVVSAGMLWFYSTTFKKQFLVGNILVSLLTAFVILIIILFEPLAYNALSANAREASRIVLTITLVYALFAFLISMIREIVKDMEDFQGDKNQHCKTMPIVIGIEKSRIVAAAITLVLIFILAVIQFKQIADNYAELGLFQTMISKSFQSFWYILIMVQFPLIYFLIKLFKANTKNYFSHLSSVVKFIMLTGILSMAYFYYVL